ncbi:MULTISPECIES: Ig-like domain-containing protein [unclassified Sphingobium]|uniref:Ig-like domain-containing protein n=1 Tax=unclassified Sphingobium TaxID=2611147 RepID=UPI0007703C0F|nr:MULTISPECIES: VCBS domain-containing protein [unclassified Sphingobium]AMK22831.1 outer membrane adhesin-like protein [Sphingobium sp. TKS]NML89029.1 tandem-95 repeat protein [Sphingobium sp. TB-6]
MDFERDWNSKDTADHQQTLHPEAAALAAKGKAVHPGKMHHADVVRTVAPNPDGTVVLPAGTDINQIEVSGRNLIVHLPDGTDMVILDGAVVMPRLVVGDVEIPSVNLAALLIGEEPQPAAGPPRSSGGNFLGPDGNVGDPHGLGDLLPPTELLFPQPETREILPIAPDEEPEVTIITPDQPTGATAATAGVSEAGLPARGNEPAGSAAASDSERTTGTIAITANDGLAGVTINGVAITTVGQTVVTPLGVLTITSIAQDAIGYSYVLSDNVVGAPPAEVFTVVVTDNDGDQASATLTISIADDAPTAVNDVDSVTEDGPLVADGNVLTGSGGSDANATDGVADIQGADGAVVSTTGTFQGTYGTLTLTASGGYSYTLANGNAAVQFLVPGQTLTDSFSYTITDADGDTSTATLTITINGADDGITITGLNGAPGIEGAEVIVLENDLSDGSSPDAAALTKTGSFGVNGADGLSGVTVGGVSVLANGAFVAGQVVTTPVGTLTITGFTATATQGGVPTAGTFTYSFVLTDNSLGHSGAGVDSILQSFAVVATDRNGSTANATVDVQIVDDVPTANNDVDGVAAGTYGPETGNVITGAGTVSGAAGADVKGADGAVVATTGTFEGAYGTLTLNADGSYSYVRAAGTPGGVSDSFSYTLRDGDGDLSTATLRIDIANSDVMIISIPKVGEGTIVDESGLTDPVGSNAGSGVDTTDGTITYTAPDGPASVTINNIPITSVGQEIVTDKGILTITGISEGSIDYSYTLTTNTTGDNVTDSFVVTVTDVDGDQATDTLTITIIDDVPTATNDADSVREDGPLVADGNVIAGSGGGDANATDGNADVQGADGAHVSAIVFGETAGTVGAPLAGLYGSLVIQADGSYAYTLNNENGVVQGLDKNQTLTETFTYTLTDGDGDPSSATITITIQGSDDGVTINGLDGEGAEETVLENDLPGGSSEDAAALTQTGSFTLSALDGVATITVGGQPIFGASGFISGVTLSNAYGTLSITGFTPTVGADGDVIGGTVSYSYVLNDNTLLHTGANDGSLTDSFAVVVTDTDGSTDSASLDIRVVDDVPTAVDDSAGQLTENAAVTIDVFANDVAGADGVDLASGVALETGAAKGTVVYQGNGVFLYTPNAGAEGSDSFTYTITDGDGDKSTATVTINLLQDSTPTVTVADMTVSEAGLPGGTQEDGNSETATGSMTIATGGDTLTKVEVQDKNGAWIDVTAANAGTPVVVAGAAGMLTVTSDGAGHYSYSYTLAVNDPIHPDNNPLDGDGISGAADPKAGDAFAVRVTDSDGDLSPADTINVTVLDDAPIAAPDSGSVTEGDSLVVTAGDGVLHNDQPGADGYAPGVVGVAKGSDASTSVSGDVGTAVAGDYGTLTLFADGSYRYDATPNVISADKQDVFVYTIRDADGDLATTTLTINVANVALAADNQTKTVFEAALDTSITGDDIAAGSVTGSTPGQPTETTTGQLNVVGAVSYTLTGPATGSHGQLLLNSDGSYTYTLTSPVDGPTANDGALPLAGVEVFTYQAVDGSGNIANGTITIDVVDDIPTAVDDAAQTVAEDGANIGGNVLTNDTQGADGATLTSVTIGGVTTAVNAEGTTNVNTAYGAYTFTAAGAWTFNPSTNLNNASGVSAGFSYVITDGDGDQSTAVQPITVTDGADPSASGPVSLTLDDQNLAGGTSSGNPDSTSGTITFTPGSDAITSIVFGGTGSLTGDLNWVRVSDNQITGSDERGVVVTLDLSVVGNVATVTATLNDNYDTHPGINVDDLVALGSVQVIAQDTDGDTATGTVSVSVSDDLPVVSANPVVQLDDDALGGNANGTGDDANSVNATGTLGHDYRADGAGGITLLGTGAPAGFTYESNGSVLLVKQGGTTVLTVTLTDPVAGTYSVAQNAAIVHPLGGDENNVSFDIAYRVTDADNDTATGTLTINVDDDTPVAADDTDIVKEDVTLSASGNVLTGVGSDGNPAGADSLGADGPAAGGAVTAVTGGPIGGNAIGSYGTLVLNASGGYTYTLNNGLAAVQHLDDGQTLTDSFTYTITDGDGDSTTAVLRITIQGTNDAPQVGSGVAVVSEEGLTGANADSAPGLPNDTTNATVATGTITASDVDGDGISMTLDNPGAVLTADGLPVTWSGVGTQTLTGSVGAVPVITITITNGGAYTVTLLQSVDHSGINVEDVKNFLVPVNVSDGTATVATSIAVTIEDDSPIAVDDNVTTIEKAAASTGNVLTNDHVGADTPGAVVSVGGNAIALGGSQTIVGAYGTLQLFSDGSYIYTPKVSVPSGSFDSFTYVMRDADNDTASATLKFTFQGDANKPTADNTAAKLDDDGLTGGNAASTTGDVDANVGDNGLAGPSEASYSGTLPFTFGADGGGSVSFANLNGTTGTVGTDTVSYSWNGTTNTLTATITTVGGRGTPLFQVVVNPTTGAYTVTLLDNVLHAAGGNENDASVSLNFLVTDSDYNATTNPTSSAIGQLNISFNDDMPSAFTPAAGSVANNDSPATAFNLNFANVAGADGVGNALFTVTDGAPAKDTSGATLRLAGEDLFIFGNGTNVLTAKTADGDIGYTITLQPGTDKYVFDLYGTITNGSEISISSFSAAKAGNTDYRGLGVDTTDAIDVLFSGRSASGARGSVNTDSDSIGVDNQSVNPDEAVRIDLIKTLVGNPATTTGFAYADHQSVISFEQNIAQVGGNPNNTVSIKVTAIDADNDQDLGFSSATPETGESFVPIAKVIVTDVSTGNIYTFTGTGSQGSIGVTFASGSVTISGLQVNDKYEIVGTKGFDAVLVESPHVNNPFDLGVFSVETLNSGAPININHAIVASDADGDSVNSSVSVTLTPVAVPPVAIDLDGDGLEFVGLSSGVTHDYGHGEVATAWVSSDDGLLAHATGGSYDIVFADDAPGAASDLDGLRLAYDSNGDGVFDAKDAAFAEFGVWQDANGNGVVDAGEFKSLTDAGIAAIELNADGKSYTAANGDVTVLGEASFVRTDGTKGTIGDVLFATGAKESDASKTESTASGFNQALVAASLVAVAGATATTTEEQPAPTATDSAAPVTETAPAATVTAEPTTTQEDSSTKIAATDDKATHEQPAAPASHGGEEAAPEHATLSGGGDAHAAATETAEAPQPDLGGHQGLLAQSIDLPPVFDGNAAAVLAAQQAAPAANAAEVVKEALGAHDVPNIDALLAALPGGEHVAAPFLLNPVAGEAMDSGHLAAATAIFDAAMVAHEAMAVAHG